MKNVRFFEDLEICMCGYYFFNSIYYNKVVFELLLKACCFLRYEGQRLGRIDNIIFVALFNIGLVYVQYLNKYLSYE